MGSSKGLKDLAYNYMETGREIPNLRAAQVGHLNTQIKLAKRWIKTMAPIYRSKGDGGSIAFITISFSDLLLLFWCLHLFERATPGSVTRERIKVAVWSLATLLTLMFSWKVAILMPLPVAVVVWVMAAATSVGGFYAFFLLKE
ncbi:hypothetical protein LUZ61_012763 [Rhynchospora tenuis]|uniref:Uncharacterized protein n=1 Tax=Rhynchospora tenuis TaxID=198213 RepID=A0AAD6A3Y7_9POAL|nr:hypothetical protein LUZ61_012763 [Rhynchospora tenuis]